MGFRQKVGHLASVDPFLASNACLQQFLAATLERTVQFGDQSQRLGGENGFVTGLDRCVDVHAGGQIETHAMTPFDG
ncbi:MAG: hypothetical protein AW09_003143 [Candidatus Accumulibacter phosphatis]|uniref:Uncharacterized protein n=1 Tax=Candidatus Accumulibacter phosphatis TaxID=327160 RepID=A0A080LTE6_9PROT|nr:MAG: hypothetical protein AW09_003143 [Candidatus Accumulibacter phosphatis]